MKQEHLEGYAFGVINMLNQKHKALKATRECSFPTKYERISEELQEIEEETKLIAEEMGWTLSWYPRVWSLLSYPAEMPFTCGLDPSGKGF